jgi:hypothetical protein
MLGNSASSPGNVSRLSARDAFCVQGGAVGSQSNSLGAAPQDVGGRPGGAGDSTGEAPGPDDAALALMHDLVVALRTLNSPAPNRSEAEAMEALLGLGHMPTRTPVTIPNPVTTRSGRESRRSAKYSHEEYVAE